METPVTTTRKNIVIVFSGGLDSLVLLYWTLKNHPGERIVALCFDYGQRGTVERSYARSICSRLGVEFQEVDIHAMSQVFGNCSLTNGSNSELSGKSTVVPNRNTIFLMIAAAACQSMGGGVVMYGAHRSTAGIYPDTTPNFCDHVNDLLQVATEGKVSLVAPLIWKTKADVVAMGADLKVPFEESWSCYESQDHHCGECYACKDRQAAFLNAMVPDPTVYAYQLPQPWWQFLSW